jgi:hypothetical protein
MRSNTATNPYIFQCTSGRHWGEVTPDTELDRKAKKRETDGFIDAATLSPDDCPACVDDARENQQKNWDMLGCPDHWDEKCGCAPATIPDSPYEKQVDRLHYY